MTINQDMFLAQQRSKRRSKLSKEIARKQESREITDQFFSITAKQREKELWGEVDADEMEQMPYPVNVSRKAKG